MSSPSGSPAPTHRAERPRRVPVLRVLLPALLVVVWLAATAIGGPFFGRIGEVSSNDRAAYLPESAEATQVQELATEFTGSDAIPAIVVVTSETALDPGTLEEIGVAAEQLNGVATVSEGVSPPIPSEDGVAVQIFVPVDPGADAGAAVEEIRAELTAALPEGLTVHVAGPAAFAADLGEAFAGIDGLLLGVALAAVFVILVLVYRSPLLPLIVLTTSVAALCAALLVIWNLANAGVLLLSGQTQGILFILVIGAATDYSLLYVARYRDELRRHHSAWLATLTAVRAVLPAVLASGGTVIAGLLCLLLSDLKSNSILGPVAAIGILFAMLAGLTMLPAILALTGRVAFWPRRPHYDPAAGQHEESVEEHGLWGRVAQAVARRPRPIWIVTAVLLAVGCLGVLRLDATGVAQSELVLGESAAREGQEALAEHFPAGQGSPVQVIAPTAELEDVGQVLREQDGIDSISVTAADSPSGAAALTEDGLQAAGPPGTPAPEPTEVDGTVLVQGTLTDASDSPAAEQTVRDLRAEFDEAGSEALVGGVTATSVDTNDAAIADRTLIIPLVLVVIALILMALLRSVVAPLLLVATTVLSFGTALGVSALVFEVVFGFPGADPAVPLYAFVFLVALGIDYNIFLMTRVREEALTHGTREGVVRGLATTGGVITSAGLVLAATFAALGVIPILFLAQIAFIVAFGVLLDTFVVRSLLVPALSIDIGRRIWWPSALSRRSPLGGSGPGMAP